MNTRVPLLPAAGIAVLTLGAASFAIHAHHTAAELPVGVIQVQAGTGTWSPGPPSLPAGSQVMALEGNSANEGMFTIRLRIPAGAKLRPHWHPNDERVTVLEGEVRVGFGDTVDAGSMTTFAAGSFYVNPAKSHHYVQVTTNSVLQLTGIGPWGLHYVDEMHAE